MNQKKINTVYILSGPAGVGKSTTAQELVKNLENSAYISGDCISHMHVNGRKNPWESQEETFLIWDNIASVTKNFLTYGNDVVVDYVTFPRDVKGFCDKLKGFNVEIKYVVLWANNEILRKRDNMRVPEHRMGERCFVLVDEFKMSGLAGKYILDTSNNPTIASVVNEIMTNPNYKVR